LFQDRARAREAKASVRVFFFRVGRGGGGDRRQLLPARSEGLCAVGVVDPAVKKRMLNRLRRHPHLQKALRRLIANATARKRKPVKKTHIEKIFEILFEPIKKGV
jgi:hypothetical protein